jgi:hypothetical protein
LSKHQRRHYGAGNDDHQSEDENSEVINDQEVAQDQNETNYLSNSFEAQKIIQVSQTNDIPGPEFKYFNQ